MCRPHLIYVLFVTSTASYIYYSACACLTFNYNCHFNGPKAITLNCNAKLFCSSFLAIPHGDSCEREEKVLSRSDCAFEFSLDSAQNACKANEGDCIRVGGDGCQKVGGTFFNV